MPTKKAKGKKKKNATVEPKNEEDVKRSSLIQGAVDLKTQIEKEDVSAKNFQRNLEKIKDNWQLSNDKLKALKGSLNTKETCLISLKDNHQINVRTYQRDIKQLLYEHQNEESTTKYDSEALLKLTNDENKSREAEIKDCETKLKNNLKEK
eukprot:CAMPEP_0194376224 /NCGR_PEP_ID=MMETSP0174-20130528/24674_1 /TAXON_ID=216777 /ORGANISM="Proboscia alata, Strain PI-D3" /LENGTH=150 /DNA_ID=CAMNT_0039156801 /DNA_START=121 /DNA_END=570 /DNA_ORIENTATION=+